MEENCKIKLDLSETFLQWFVITSSSLNIEGLFDNKKLLEIADKQVDGFYTITMQVNGIEVNPKVAIEELEKQYNTSVKSTAEKLLKEKYNVLLDEVQLKTEELRETINKKISETIN